MGDKSKCPGSSRARCQISAKRGSAFEMIDNGGWLSSDK